MSTSLLLPRYKKRYIKYIASTRNADKFTQAEYTSLFPIDLDVIFGYLETNEKERYCDMVVLLDGGIQGGGSGLGDKTLVPGNKILATGCKNIDFHVE